MQKIKTKKTDKQNINKIITNKHKQNKNIN